MTPATPPGPVAPSAPSRERVILVDAADVEIGSAEKLSAHQDGLLHRAFSVFIVNPRGEVLLQQRAETKYHSGGLWSNACCGHPRPGEAVENAARRRLEEELGFTCALAPAGSFLYRADVGGGLVEHEVDHLFIGRWAGDPAPDPGEVAAWRWAPADRLRLELVAAPHRFTRWFRFALEELDRLGALAPARRPPDPRPAD